MGLKHRISSAVSKVSNTSTEELSPSQQFQNFRNGSFGLKFGEFISDLLGDERLEPHDEFRQGWRMMQNDIQIAQSVSTLNLLTWGREITVETEDEATKEYFDQEILPKFKEAAMVAGRNAWGTGNGHIEVIRNDVGVPVDFMEMDRPHKVYNQYSEDSWEVEAYIQEAFRYNKGETFQVLKSDQSTKRVKGFKFPADDIIHLKTGNGTMPGYGRSDFLSAIDDYKIARELKRFQGVSARYKMDPRKVFVFNETEDSTGIDDPGSTADGRTRKEREATIDNLGKNEVAHFHDVELDIKDYSYDAKMPEAQQVLDKLSRDMTSPLPQFLSHASDSNRATSRESKNVLQMQISSTRQRWKSQINPVLQEIAEARGLDTDVELEFGDFTFPTRDEKTKEVQDLFRNNMITLGQAVQRLPFDVEVAEEYEDMYYFELDTNDNPFDQLGQKLDKVKDKEIEQSTLEDLIDNE